MSECVRLTYVVVIGEASRSGCDPEVSRGGEDNALLPEADLVVLFVVGHSVVDVHLWRKRTVVESFGTRDPRGSGALRGIRIAAGI